MVNRTFSPFPVLRTERLSLRQLVMEDEQQIFALRSDREVNQYLDRQASHTLADARDFISKVNAHITKNEALYWAITLSAPNLLVGTVCFFGFSEEHDRCEIGYELLPGFQRQGIMQEAVAKVISYAFHTLKVQKIEAFLHQDNVRSVRLLDHFSFQPLNKPDEASPELIGYRLTPSMDDL